MLLFAGLFISPIGSSFAHQPVAEHPGQASAWLELVTSAYSREATFEIRYREAGQFAPDTPAEVIASTRKIPGVSALQHPESGAELFDLRHCRLLCDGRGSLRLETHNLMMGGPPDGATSVAVWSPAATGTIDFVGQRRAMMRPLGPSSGAELERASLAFFELARHLIGELGRSTATRAETSSGQAWLRADDVGVAIRIDPSTGEILEAHATRNKTLTAHWKWSEWLEGSWFPARHPKRQIVRYEDSSQHPATSRQGDMIVFDSIRVALDVSPEQFQWSLLAPRAVNRITQDVVRPDGTVDEAATAKFNRQSSQVAQALPPPEVVPGGMRPASSGLSPSRAVLGLGLVALCLAGGMGLRRLLNRRSA